MNKSACRTVVCHSLLSLLLLSLPGIAGVVYGQEQATGGAE